MEILRGTRTQLLLEIRHHVYDCRSVSATSRLSFRSRPRASDCFPAPEFESHLGRSSAEPVTQAFVVHRSGHYHATNTKSRDCERRVLARLGPFPYIALKKRDILVSVMVTVAPAMAGPEVSVTAPHGGAEFLRIQSRRNRQH